MPMPGGMPGAMQGMPMPRGMPGMPANLMSKPYQPTDPAAAVAAAYGQPLPQNSAGTVKAKVSSESIAGHGWHIQEISSERDAKGVVGSPGYPPANAISKQTAASASPMTMAASMPRKGPAEPQSAMQQLSFASGLISSVVGYSAPMINAAPATMPWPGPMLAPPPLVEVHPGMPDPNDNVAKAKKDVEWAKQRTVAAGLQMGQAALANGFADRDVAWATAEQMAAQAEAELEKEGTPAAATEVVPMSFSVPIVAPVPVALPPAVVPAVVPMVPEAVAAVPVVTPIFALGEGEDSEPK